MLAKRPDGLLQVDLVAVDLDPVLGFERGRDVLVGDRAERLVLGPYLQPHHNRLVVDLIGDDAWASTRSLISSA